MSEIKVVCEKCTSTFFVRKPKKKLHKDGIEGTLTIYYISCPDCKENFVSFVENEKIKKLVKDNQSLYRSLSTIKDTAEYDTTFKEFQKNVTRIDTLRKDLIFRFKKYV